MEVEESERVVIAKPVASRPNCSRFKSFSKLLAGVIDSPCSKSFSEPIVAAIRPKTVRFRPAASQAEVPRTVTCDPASEDLKPQGETTVIYKPKAKLALRSPISLLVNAGSVHTSRRPALSSRVEDLVPRPETDEDVRSLNTTSNVDGNSNDGYNWRKYGQKHVKGSEYPRSYYKCTHPNCPMKKKVERSFEGQIAEIVYKGDHSHAKPRVPKRGGSLGSHQGLGTGPDDLAGRSSTDEGKECRLENRNTIGSSSLSTYHGKGQLGCEPNSSCGPSGGVDGRTRGAEMEDEGPRNKRRKIESQSSEAGISGEGVHQEEHVVVQRSSNTDPLGDGFRWRKYGQKVVKGSPYPRSYYRCTSLKCNVRKHVERASDDPTLFVTTYEGKHNHEIPTRSATPSSDHP